MRRGRRRTARFATIDMPLMAPGLAAGAGLVRADASIAALALLALSELLTWLLVVRRDRLPS